MPFCNSCGNNLESGAKFCPKCGAAQAVTTGAAAVPVAPPAQPQSNSALKVILIVVVAVVVLGILAIGTVLFVGLRIARHTRVENRDGKVRVESPFGTVETATNPADVTRDLGVDVYPGARAVNGKSANVTIGGMHTVAAEFETDDSADKVAQFYQSKFPNANVSSSTEGQTTIVSTANGKMVTITIDAEGSGARIHITDVSGKGVTGGTGG